MAKINQRTIMTGVVMNNSYSRPNNRLQDVGAIFEQIKKDFADVSLDGNVQKEILKEAAQIGVTIAQMEAPRAEDVVKVYNTGKVSDKYRAPKGKGQVKKTIKPGNLAKHIKIYTHGKFKKIHHAVFYGPKYPQVAYAHLLEFGTKFMKREYPFMRPSFEKAKMPMLALIKGRYKQQLMKVAKQAAAKKQTLQ